MRRVKRVRRERWVMISTGVLWLSVWLVWPDSIIQLKRWWIVSLSSPLIGQLNPFKCCDWPSQITPWSQLCYAVSQSCCCPICLHWLTFSSTIVTINIWWLRVFTGPGWGQPRHCNEWKWKLFASFLFEREIVKKDRDKMFTGTLHRMLNCILFVWR